MKRVRVNKLSRRVYPIKIVIGGFILLNYNNKKFKEKMGENKFFIVNLMIYIVILILMMELGTVRIYTLYKSDPLKVINLPPGDIVTTINGYYDDNR